MRILQWLCISIFSMLFLSGCWDRTEVNDLAVITAAAYDKTAEGFEGTVQIILPSSGAADSGQSGGKSQSVKTYTTGIASNISLSLDESYVKLQKKFSRKLFRGHRRVIIIGEEMSRNGLEELIDYLSRDPNSSLHTPIVVAKGRTGAELLKTSYPMERASGEAMREMINIAGRGLKVTKLDFLIKAASEGVQPIAATIEPVDDKEGFRLTGVAIFKNLKLAGYLNNEETVGFLWATGNYEQGFVTISVPGHEGEISVNVKSGKAQITPEINDHKVTIYVALKGEGSISSNSTKLDFTIPENIALVEQAVGSEITKQVQRTIKIVQRESGADIFGFGSTINQRNPKEWKHLRDDWDNIFPQAEVSVSTKFSIRTTNMTGTTPYLKENEVKK
ncbi:MAG: Ger(x)C family spore germination protein [Firmicutes bacterium]|nr:Ger(x)C family spore germination protein [Bacillota bacterium]